MINLVVGGDGLLPADQASAEYLDGCKLGQVIACKPSKVRNYQFHKKYFALLKVAFELWEPPYQKSELLEGRFGKPEPNYDRFRKELLIMAGFAEPVINLRGEYKLEAKSISFSKMKAEEFEDVYNRTIDAALKILPDRINKKDIDNAVNKILNFA